MKGKFLKKSPSEPIMKKEKKKDKRMLIFVLGVNELQRWFIFDNGKGALQRNALFQWGGGDFHIRILFCLKENEL